MYFLTKFCRFCVQSDLELNELGMVDFDGVKLSEKMETCLNLINDPVSTHIPYICKTCTNKLRVSYNFHKVCKKSTAILQGYLEKLTVFNENDDVFFNINNFQNWDVEVAVTAIPRLGIVKTSHSNIQQTKTIDKDYISGTESESESEESDVEMQDTGQNTNQTVKNSIIKHEEQTKTKKIQSFQPVYTERRRIGKIPPSTFKDGAAKGKSNKLLELLNKEPQTRIKTEIDYPEIINISAVFSENQNSQVVKNEGYRLGQANNYQYSQQNIDEESIAQPVLSRIRVRNFQNEPIQNQTESNQNQNVLSEIEKVVNDVPASFKKQQKTRITKEQRCTLLKQLLESAEKQKKDKNSTPRCSISKEGDGLKGILSFTENYKFLDKKTTSSSSGGDLDKFNTNQNHLDKLERFARDYFKKKSFKEFKDIIMYIIEHKDDESAFIFYDSDVDDEDNDDIFGRSEADDEETDTAEEGEEMVVEPDIDMKHNEDSESTFDYVVETNLDDELGLVVSSSDDEQPNESTQTATQKTLSPLRNHRTTPPNKFVTWERHSDKSVDGINMSLPGIRPYSRAHCASTSSDSTDTQDKVKIKEEPSEDGVMDGLNLPNNPFDVQIKNEFSSFSHFFNSRVPEEGEIFMNSPCNPGPSNYSQEFQSYLNKKYSSESVNMLDHLVANYPMQKKMFSPLNARCRTRNQPYISPHLMDQFKFQCFRCEKCNRNFKSQGYLKAHASKIH